MKIKVTTADYADVEKILEIKHVRPMRQLSGVRKLMKAVSMADLKSAEFEYMTEGMEKLDAKQPAIYLMNHSSSIDLEIVAKLLEKKPYHIVTTLDGFIGKAGLMRGLGCIPARKFITDTTLVRDMLYILNTLKESIVLYPEASYSFDGCATSLPDSVGKMLKLSKAPVVMIRTHGAFLRDPLYNNLQKRHTKVSAQVKYLFSAEQCKSMKADEINEVLRREFSFDNFREQQENHIKITEKFRADHLDRVLYKCPYCYSEEHMEGKGILLSCHHCGAEFELTEEGYLRDHTSDEIRTRFEDHVLETKRCQVASLGAAWDEDSLKGDLFHNVHDWFVWERYCVRKELEEGTYRLDVPVKVLVLADLKSMYEVGEGRLVHTLEGFKLSGCDDKLHYEQGPSHSYSLYADYYWYELGDMISIGDMRRQYYCFPDPELHVNVAKARLATEELFKVAHH